jgi:hypothetical protein
MPMSDESLGWELALTSAIAALDRGNNGES